MWNDAATATDVPDAEDARASLLRAAIRSCAAQVAAHTVFEPKPTDVASQFIVEQRGFEGSPPDLLVGLCERSAQGGGLKGQLEDLERARGTKTLVVVRSTDYPSNPKTQIAKFLGGLVRKGARRVKVEDADWRRMASFLQFEGAHRHDPNFGAFVRTDRPLLSVQALQELLAADKLRPVVRPDDQSKAEGMAETAGRSNGNAQTTKTSPPTVNRPDWIAIGRTLGAQGREVRLDIEALKRHAAFLGGTGSGKTTAALQVVEELLLRGIPALLVDRKGDLAGYALDEVWEQSTGDAERDRVLCELREHVHVDLYTPGNPDGRSFSIRLLPPNLTELSPHERQQAARMSATALGGMMGLRGQKLDRAVAVLQDSLTHTAAALEKADFGLDAFVSYLADPDPSLFAVLGPLKDFLAENVLALEVMLRGRGSMLKGNEPLDVGRMLAPTDDGRTKLAIVSTKFVGGAADVQFWVSHLVSDFNRMGQRHPSDRLQAVMLLDEADLYLPANAQPASKQPVEDLLRRGRSAGLGVLLATQSPGDLDYRCRDNVISWFIGRVGQKTAMAKLEPLFEGRNANVQALAQQDVGQFHYVGERTLERMQFTRNLVRLPAQVPDAQILGLAARGRPSR
jgi:hypothetical protein